MLRDKRLKVCKECGWHKIKHIRHDCEPEAGAAADHLAAALPSVKSTKLGYGHGRLTFNFDKKHSVTLVVYEEEEMFVVEDLHWRDDLDEAAAVRLVLALKGGITPPVPRTPTGAAWARYRVSGQIVEICTDREQIVEICSEPYVNGFGHVCVEIVDETGRWASPVRQLTPCTTVARDLLRLPPPGFVAKK